MTQRQSRAIRLGPLAIGGGAPVMVQSMTNTDTRDVEATTAQIMIANPDDMIENTGT